MNKRTKKIKKFTARRIINMLEKDELIKGKFKVEFNDLKKQKYTTAQSLFKIICGLELKAKAAEKYLNNILEHRTALKKRLGRDMNFKVIIWDYFTSKENILKDYRMINNENLRQLIEASFFDSLTHLYNRRFLYQALTREIARAKRYHEHLSVLFLDIDDFKNFNDRYGHIVGDKVLREFANILRYNFRSVDIITRYGGDEFVVILPETDTNGAIIVSNRINKFVSKHPIAIKSKLKVRMTISGGLAVFPEDGLSSKELLTKSDIANYRAKRDGKNRIYPFFTEKREFKRINVNWGVRFSVVKGKKYSLAKSRNISCNGILFNTSKHVLIDSTVKIKIKVPRYKNEMNLVGRITRIVEVRPKSFEIGVQFLEIEEKDRLYIMKLK